MQIASTFLFFSYNNTLLYKEYKGGIIYARI